MSGDVMAGIVAGLCARGTAPLDAAMGCLAARRGRKALRGKIGPIGFLARQLLAHKPSFMRGL